MVRDATVREVCNGGFDQYFHNSSGDYFDSAVEGLRTIGALESLRLLLAAKEVLFGDAAVPVDTGDRRIFLAAADSETESNRDEALDALDRAFYEDPDKFADRMREFAKKHDLQKNF
ncbi:MAG: DMP19 family protein [Zoogloeaceae bacterium]|nr:DMP19 family protein [Zoogloeaceae bacterium]